MPRSQHNAPSPHAESLLVLAARLLKAGRSAEAIAPLYEAATLQPTNADIHHDLGLALLEAERIPDAITALQRAIALKPRYTDAHFRLGIALEKLGDIGGAIAAYDRATHLLPSLAEAWFRAGALVYTLGHRDEAIGCFRRAAATGGTSTFGRLGKARALLTEERNQEAEQALRQTITLDPSNAMALDLLGNLLTEYGRFDEARECFEQAIALSPLLAGSYYELVRCRQIARDATGSDGLLQQKMEAALATPGLEASQRLRLHLALGKAADDLGDYALAIQHFDAGYAMRRDSLAFDSAGFAQGIDRLIARCTAEWIAQTSQRKPQRSSNLGSEEATPILILGMPRSGTTLVEQIVSNHPDAGGGGELHFWNQRGAVWHSKVAANSSADSSADSWDEAPFLAKAVTDYLDLLHAIAPGAARVTDKMPFNFLWAGLVHRAFPNATMIHCRRNAIDTALSIHQTHFQPSLAFPTGGAELVAYFRSYQRLMEHWRTVLPADRFIEVDYEELTITPEPVIRRIIAACGLAWHDVCLHPESNLRAVKTPSRWQARQPIYRDSVARWRRYEPWLGPLRELLGNGRQDGGQTDSCAPKQFADADDGLPCD